jgi:preprotein translocase subunit SecG
MIAGSPMFWINFFIYAFLLVLVVACPLMCLVIMMQRSKQEGLGAAFGGGFTESVWGAQTSNVLVKATVILAATFFIVSIALARLYTIRAHVLERPSTLQQQLLNPSVPMTATNASGTPVVPTATPLTSTTPATSTPASTNAATTLSAPIPATNAAPAAKPPATK